MVGTTKKHIKIDLNQFKLHLNCKPDIELTLHFNTPSRKFYLTVIALVANEMKKQKKITSILLQNHFDTLKLLNKTVGQSAGSSKKEYLLPRIYRKWKDVLPDLEKAPLFQIIGRKKKYDDSMDKVYPFKEKEKDSWANLFEYMGSHENVRLKFAIDKLSLAPDDVDIVYGEPTKPSADAWNSFIDHLKKGQNDLSDAQPVDNQIAIDKAVPKTENQIRSRKLSPRRLFQIALTCAAVIFIVFIFWQYQKSVSKVENVTNEKNSNYSDTKPTIAVLPFDNIGGDPEQEYFSDGMIDDIITDLSKISGLMVISRNSTFVYKGKKIAIPEVAQKLGANYVLEGSIRRSGEKVRINAQLINAATDSHVWAERFDGEDKNIFTLQDKITNKIVSALSVKITNSEQKIVSEKGTYNIAAHDTLLKGMSHMRKFTPKDYVIAIEYFEKAVKLDPDYSEAYAKLAIIYMNALHIGQRFWDESGIDFPTARLLARHYVKKAMRKPTSTSFQVLARLEHFKRNFSEALEHAEHAVAISPNDADALYTLGIIMVWADKPEEGIKYIKKSIMLDPLHKSTGEIGRAYFILGDYELAAKYIEKNLKDYPENYQIQGILASTYAYLGNDALAKKAYKEFRS